MSILLEAWDWDDPWFWIIHHSLKLRCPLHVLDILDLENDLLSEANLFNIVHSQLRKEHHRC